MNPQVDLYLIDGCGRCDYYATPKCKVHQWREILIALRQIVLECGLTEELKWSMPVYTFQNKNIVMISAFKEYCSLNFFKGVLLKDEQSILVKQGESSQSARLVKFTDLNNLLDLSSALKNYIFESIENEKQNIKVEFKKNLEPVPQELEIIFKEQPLVKKAFYALTPGRQRGYLIHFAQPKQSNTRLSRIEKCIPLIMKNEGLNDAYKQK